MAMATTKYVGKTDGWSLDRSILLVDEDSAGPQLPGVTSYGIEAVPSGMCKPERTHVGYLSISTAIREWIDEAPAVIQMHWMIEEEDEEEGQAGAQHNLDEFRGVPLVSIFQVLLHLPSIFLR